MLNTLFLFLAQTRLFWKVRRALSYFVFINYRMLFKVRHRIQEEKTTTKSLMGPILDKLFLAIFIAIVLQISNPYLVPWFTERGFTISKGSNYGTLLATLIGAGGIFIGLYYAAISNVCNAIYARASNSLQDLLIRERVGITYIRFIAIFTFFGVCLFVFHVAGGEPVILAMPLLLLGAGLTIIGFVRLGLRAFYLTDPRILSHVILKQLQQCHMQMRAGGYRWSDQSFQNHAHRIAQTAIDTLTTVSDITAKDQYLSGRPFVDLCKHLLSFLCRYETGKKTIPTNSLSYRRRYVHQDWYRASDTEISIGHQTATGLQPKPVSDPRWIESTILPIVKRCLEINLKDNRYVIVNELLNYLDVYLQRLAKEQRVESAFNLMQEIFSQCEGLILSTEEGTIVEESLEHMGICELLATMPINVLIAYISVIESYGRNKIFQRIRRITWKSEKSIYRARFAVHVLEQLEWLRPRLEFERRVEGRIVSPIWYLGELIVQKEAENLRTAMICYYEKACNFYKHWIETATSSKNPWLTAVIISTELEYWNKLDHNTNTLDHLWNDLNSDRRIKDLPWPSLDIDKLVEKRKQRKKELLRLMSTENIRLVSMSRSESYPDFAGQFLHTVGEALLTAMCEDERDMVEALFKGYFYGNRLQCERLRPQENMPQWQLENKLKIAVAPLLDLMDLSGYAYLFSEYHDTPCLKATVAKVWDEYLDQDSVQSELQFLAAAISLTESAFEIAHRGINRTKWMQVIERRLSSVERQEVDVDYGGILSDTETVVIHESPLVRVLARNRELSYDGIDIFLAKYVRQREDGINLDFGGARRRDIEEAIRREENRDTMSEWP